MSRQPKHRRTPGVSDEAGPPPMAVGAVPPEATEPRPGAASRGRTRRPVLAAAGIGGAVLLAIPILLVGRGSHHHEEQRTDAAGTMLAPNGGGRPPEVFAPDPSEAAPTPSATRPKAKPKAPKADPRPKKRPKPTAEVEDPAEKPSPGSSTGPTRVDTVPSGELPKSGGAPYALEVRSPLDLRPGDTWRTNVIALTMRRDGNLVLRDKRGRIIWSSGTHRAGVYCELQTDGNLVLYAGRRTAVWASGTDGHPDATLVLRTDSTMAIYDDHHAVWTTGPHSYRP